MDKKKLKKKITQKNVSTTYSIKSGQWNQTYFYISIFSKATFEKAAMKSVDSLVASGSQSEDGNSTGVLRRVDGHYSDSSPVIPPVIPCELNRLPDVPDL